MMVNRNQKEIVAPERDREPRSPNLEPRSSTAGFTLLELLIVILLLSTVAALVFPRLPSGDNSALKGSARSTAALLRYLGERASSSKIIYRLHVNLSESTITVTRKQANGDELPPDDPLLARKVLESGVTIADLQSPRLGKVTEGEVQLDFSAGGLSEFVTLHLKSSRGEHFTVAGYPAGGKVKLFAGYQELTL